MAQVIMVGVGMGKQSLQDALNESHGDTILILDPGKYQLPLTAISNNMLLRGTGEFAEDVVIEGTFKLMTNTSLEIENLMIQHTSIANSLISMSENSELTARGVIFHSLGGTSANIYLKRATLNLIGCEVRQVDSDGRGIVASDHSSILIDRSDIQYLKLSETKLVSKTSQIRVTLLLRDYSELSADTLYITDSNTQYYELNGKNHVSLKIDNLQLPEGITRANFLDSDVRATTANISQQYQLIVQTNQTNHITIPNAQINQINNQENLLPKTDIKDIDRSPSNNENKLQPNDAHRAIDKLNAMIGLASVKQEVSQFIALAKFNQKRAAQGLSQVTQSLHSVFYGNPGTGKTTVARLVAQAMYEEGVMPSHTYIEVARQDLVAQYVGATAIKTQQVLEKAVGGVLFIDEAYSLYQADDSSNWGQEAVDTILKFMEDHRNDLMIIFAGYPNEMKDFINMNPGLESRIANQFNFADYTPEEAAEIGVQSLKQQEFTFDESYYRQVITKAYQADISHSNGRWVRNFNDKLVRVVAMHAMTTDDRDSVTILNSDLEELVGGNQLDKDQMVQELLKQLDSMIGLESVKKFIHNLINQVMISRQLGDQLGDINQPTYHMIFAGEPGTGKTTVARIIAQLLFNLDILPKDTVSEVSRTDLIGAYVGQTEEKTSRAIRNAMGGVLFIDEAYQLTSSSQDSNDFGSQAVETLITALENQRTAFVAIFAGYTDEMKHFLDANPGLRSRIPINIEFEAYSASEVAQIVAKLVGKNFQFNDELLKQVVTTHYQRLPVDERSNGRWARNFSDELIMNHKLWLGDHLDEVVDVKRIDDSLLTASLAWRI